MFLGYESQIDMLTKMENSITIQPPLPNFFRGGGDIRQFDDFWGRKQKQTKTKTKTMVCDTIEINLVLRYKVTNHVHHQHLEHHHLLLHHTHQALY